MPIVKLPSQRRSHSFTTMTRLFTCLLLTSFYHSHQWIESFSPFLAERRQLWSHSIMLDRPPRPSGHHRWFPPLRATPPCAPEQQSSAELSHPAKLPSLPSKMKSELLLSSVLLLYQARVTLLPAHWSSLSVAFP
jgi:hypothetical protein